MTTSNTRNGKIARLPRPIRDQLNRRLDDGHQGKKLVHWLNRLPEVRQSLAENFHGHPISEQNLSEWKTGGFQDWLNQRDIIDQSRELSDNAGEIHAVTHGKLADHLATILTARYAATLAAWTGDVIEAFTKQLRALRSLAQDVASFRREDHRHARVELDRQRLELARQKSQSELVELFQHWAGIPLVRDTLCQNWISPVEREIKLRQILEIAPLEAVEPEPEPEPKPKRVRAKSPSKAKAPATNDKSNDSAQSTSPVPGQSPNPFIESTSNESDLIQSKTKREQWLQDPTAKYVAERMKNLTPDDRESAHFRMSGQPNLSLAGSLAAVGAQMPKGEYHQAAEPLPIAPDQTGSNPNAPTQEPAVITEEWIAKERDRRYRAGLGAAYKSPTIEPPPPIAVQPTAATKVEPKELTPEEQANQEEGRAWRIRMGFDPIPEEPVFQAT